MGIIRKAFGKDEIDEVLGSTIYETPHYDKALRDLLLGVHSASLVPVTRFYFKCSPKVIVDFEPQPGTGRWFEAEKRRYFHERGVVYVPIALRERIDAEEFRQRVKHETEAMRETLRTMDVRPGEVVDPTVLSAARAEAHRLVEADVKAGKLKRGTSYDAALVARTRSLIATLTEQVANGSVGHDLSLDESAQPAG